MTRTTSMLHPSGVRYTAIAPYRVVRFQGQLVPVQEKKGTGKCQAGVLVEYPDGVKRFISNSWYTHIEGLKP